MRLRLLGLLALAGCSGAPTLREPERTVTAEQVYESFTTNEVRAARDFGRTPVRVTGLVALVSDNSVMMDTKSGPTLGLRMIEGQEKTLVDLDVGEKFTADCEGAKMVQHVVAMSSCRPSSPLPASSSSAGTSS